MLVLSRKKNESLLIDGGKIQITVLEIRGDKVRLGIEAPPDVSIHRAEVWAAIQAQNTPSTENEGVVAG